MATKYSMIVNHDDSDSESAPLVGGISRAGTQTIPAPVTGNPYKLSLYLMLIIVFFVNTGFAIVIPSLWPYLSVWDSPQWMLGWVVASYSAGQFISSPLMGFWANHGPTRWVIITSLIIGAAGNILYCWAPNPWVVLAARAIIGAGAGNVGVCRAYVSHATTNEERTAFMANVSAAQTVGFVLGPAIGSGLSYIKFNMGAVVINEYFAPAYLSAVLNLLALIPLIWFKEVDFHAEDKSETKNDDLMDIPPSKIGIIVTIVLFFITISEFAVLETVAVPVTQDYYNWGIFLNGIIFAGAGVISIIVFMGVRILAKRLQDRWLLLPGFAFMIPGFAVLIAAPMAILPEWRYFFGVAVISIGYPICAVITYAVYSKILGPTAQGTMMGWLTGFGSLARMAGPMWSSAVLDKWSADIVWIICAGLAVLGLIVTVIFHRWLVPHPYLKGMNVQDVSGDAHA